ncbi:MAG: hypothetical protein ACFFCW_08870 [Candidatus Hodarchaeota archaeon]
MICQSKVRILNITRLTKELAAQERRARSNSEQLDHGLNGSDDLINATALVIVVASSYSKPEIIVLG